MAAKIFYSLHFDNDCTRTLALRNSPLLAGLPAVSAHEWAYITRQGQAATTAWIDARIDEADCVVVLIGSETSTRPLVSYEISRAWTAKKGLIGIYVDGLHDMFGRQSHRGPNPFDKMVLPNGLPLSRYIPAYDPSRSSGDAGLETIKLNLQSWVTKAVGFRAMAEI